MLQYSVLRVEEMAFLASLLIWYLLNYFLPGASKSVEARNLVIVANARSDFADPQIVRGVNCAGELFSVNNTILKYLQIAQFWN